MLGSSVDPNKVSLTIKGLAVGLVPVAILITSQLGIELSQTELMEVVTQVGVAISSVMVAFGGFRKIYYRFK